MLNSKIQYQDGAFSCESDLDISNPNWMSKLSDSQKLNQISIPGTHDSMAYGKNIEFASNTRTQSLSLMNQLNKGIRYLDIRLNYREKFFAIHHGSIFLGFNFLEVLVDCAKFLEKNPSEFILMRVQQEASSASDAQIWNMFSKYQSMFKNLFWLNGKGIVNPNIEELRGKIVLLSELEYVDFSLKYSSLEVQDYYSLESLDNLEDKYFAIRDHFDKCNSDVKAGSEKIFLNHISAKDGAFPYMIAGGRTVMKTNSPRIFTGKILFKNDDESLYPSLDLGEGVFAEIYPGTNKMTLDLVNKTELNYLGIVVCDFPGPELIQKVINTNFE